MAKRTRAKKAPAAAPKRTHELNEALGVARSRYGATAVRTAAEVNQPLRIATGIFMLDFALCGGFPFNRASMIAGKRHSGKSMIGSMLIAGAQRAMPDKRCVVIDAEGTFESTWAAKLGVDLDRLYIIEAETAEMVIDMTEAVLASKETSLVIVDSLAAMVPQDVVDADAEQQFYALQARMITKLVQKATHVLVSERRRDHFVTLLYLNQLRARIGGPPKASPWIIPGGNALEHTTSIQGIIKNYEAKGGKDSRGIDTVVENQHSFSLDKNKLNNGPRAGDFLLCRMDQPDRHLHEGMVDDAHTLIAYAKKMGFYTGGGKKWTLDIRGKTYTFPNADAAMGCITEDREIYGALRKQLIQEQAAFLGLPAKFIRTIT
jgi:recombination protein RecA